MIKLRNEDAWKLLTCYWEEVLDGLDQNTLLVHLTEDNPEFKKLWDLYNKSSYYNFFMQRTADEERVSRQERREAEVEFKRLLKKFLEEDEK